MVTTIAGRAGIYGGVDGTNSAARFSTPKSVALDSAGNVYVGDEENHTIRQVTPVGTNWVVTTLAALGGLNGRVDGTGSDARFSGPSSEATDSAGSLYVADQVNHTIRKVTSAGVVTTLVGLAGYAGSTNGTGAVARFNAPHGVAADGAGNISGRTLSAAPLISATRRAAVLPIVFTLRVHRSRVLKMVARATRPLRLATRRPELR